jgi:hypothetical protein
VGNEERELKKILRKATDQDFCSQQENSELERDAKAFCLERIRARGLEMKLVCTEATLDKKRIIFYFTADGRIDFRELVKDLASKFKTRIEMRQIGVRDETKLVGGLGICGKEVCCRTFLTGFAPISIRMAKKQELVLNTSKLSGLCGRLMCCLNYEIDEESTGKSVSPVRSDQVPEAEETFSDDVIPQGEEVVVKYAPDAGSGEEIDSALRKEHKEPAGGRQGEGVSGSQAAASSPGSIEPQGKSGQTGGGEQKRKGRKFHRHRKRKKKNKQ